MSCKLQPMRTCTLCGSSTNGFYKCSKVSDGLTSWCKPCFRLNQQASLAAHPERKHRRKETIANWNKANPERALAKVKRYQSANPETVRESSRRSKRKRHPEILANNAKRRADKLSATPQWANLVRIAEIYAEAQRLTRESGEKHVVDHVIPLANKFVCGMHVETNLRVVPYGVNAATGNSFLI